MLSDRRSSFGSALSVSENNKGLYTLIMEHLIFFLEMTKDKCLVFKKSQSLDM